MQNLILKAISCFYFFISPALYTKISAQSEKQTAKNYQATPERVNDLVHTKLDVKFDYAKKYLYGREWVTVKPHFYPTDSLRLDARSMDIHKIALLKNGKLLPLFFAYNNRTIEIKLDKVYKNTETYTVFIDYTARPDELKDGKKNEKGLYFINPDGINKDKPIQIWTEGETENSSVWFPTIDKPNQKTTQEITITVPSKYVTLSNGRLVTQTKNTDGTRTDTWKMELPNSPYLFMMAVGDFKIYKDSWHGKEVSYYLEPQYAPFAKDIFGETPDAIAFFSRTLGVDYPWNKYSQIVVRDYVSGAMENTTAAVFGEPMQGNKKELADRYYSTGIEHELFHQWFGDYVTAESWSNLTLNESLAVLGELLWLEYRYGKDAADAHNFEGIEGYLNNPVSRTKDLVRFNYADKQEVFDGVTYQKGGAILYMLRNYLGQAAFNKGLQLYLTENAYKPVEVHQLRLAFEEVSGKDLNWFFNQWFFEAGHPDLHISYKWDDSSHTETVYLQQEQPGRSFVLPVAIDIYVSGKKERHNIWIKEKLDSLTFQLPVKPDLINVDADKTLVLKKTDTKTIDEYAFQYFHAPLYLDRYEALEAALKNQHEKKSYDIILSALNDKFYSIRVKAINALGLFNENEITQSLPVLKELAVNDTNNFVKAAAITVLGKLKKTEYTGLFKQSLNAESYTVQAAALNALALINLQEALVLAKRFESDNKLALYDAILNLYTNYGGNVQWPYMYNLFRTLAPPKRMNIVQQFATLTGRVENPQFVIQGIVAIKELGILGKQYGVAPIIVELLKEIKKKRILLNDNDSAKNIDEAINEINNAR